MMGAHELIAQPLTLLISRHERIRDFLAALGFSSLPLQLTLGEWLSHLPDEEILDAGMDREQIVRHIEDLIAQLDRLQAPQSARIGTLTVIGGHDKSGCTEAIRLELAPGDIVSIVGPTGAGKSRLLADIECLAQCDTPSGRQILIDGRPPDAAQRFAPQRRLVAQLSQNMNFVVDMTAGAFIAMHARCRMLPDTESIVAQVLACANALTGEKFAPGTALTQLSGGQTRALMIADAALLSASPIVLIDEIENAGVDRKRALELLVAGDKIVLMATHDPLLALYGTRRCVIRNGSIAELIATSEAERENLQRLERLDACLMAVRERLRQGGRIEEALTWPV